MNAMSSQITASAPRNILASRAMLASLNVSKWAARKLDKRVTQEAIDANKAQDSAGRFNKVLIAGDALAKIVTIEGAARAYHLERTLPWLDTGARLLPAKAFASYAEATRKFESDFMGAVESFLAAYPAMRDDARARLGEMYDPEDYPAEQELRRKFSFGRRLLPVPDAADFRVDIGDASAALIRAEIEEATTDALRAATRDVWERIEKVCRRMVDSLRDYKPATHTSKAEGVFRDSLVDNIRDLVALLPVLNITNEPTLTDIAERMSRELCRHDAKELRESDNLRTKTADAADAILNQVSAFIA